MPVKQRNMRRGGALAAGVAAAIGLTTRPAWAGADPPPDSWIGRQLVEVVPWLATELLGNAAWRYLIAAATLGVVLALRRRLMRATIVGLQRLTARTETKLDDQFVAALDPPLGYFLALIGLYFASRWLALDATAEAGLRTGLRLGSIVCLGWALLRCADLLTPLFESFARRTRSELDDRLAPLVGRFARVVIVFVVLVLVIQELGFEVSGIVAGLGVGGLAFALAAKDTLANWFGALMIYTDRPFDVGDWVRTPALEGVIEEIGLRSTKVRTFAKTVVSVPNSILANDVIENFSRMPIRRVSFDLKITYAAAPTQVRAAVAAIEALLRAHPEVDQEFWMVKFTDLGESALTIMIYYFTRTTEWAKYLQVRGDINLAILDALSELGVKVALPSRSVYLEGRGA